MGETHTAGKPTPAEIAARYLRSKGYPSCHP